MTPKQAAKSLYALDNLQAKARLGYEMAEVKYHETAWEQEAIARLRWHLLDVAEFPSTSSYFDQAPPLSQP